ncbi:unnamed protein product, partial [Closterium sp. NIES-53]
GRPVPFDTWLDDLQLYLLSDSKDSVLLFDLASGSDTAPPATADSSTRSQPPSSALPLLELSAFTTVEDLVSHLHASDARYRTAVPAEFLDRNPPPMFITLYFIVTRLPDSLRSVRDHFLSLDPTFLTVDLLEQHLLAAETSAVAVGAARGTPHPPFFEGYSPSPLAPSYASAAAADVSVLEDVGAASASTKHRSSKGKDGWGGGNGNGGGGGGSEVVVGAAVEVVAAVGLLAGVGALVVVLEAAVGVAAVEAVGLVALGLALGVSVLGVARVSSSSVGARPRLPSSFLSGFCVGRLGVVARMSFARVTVLVRLAGDFTLSTAASPASTTLGVLSVVTTLNFLAGQICLGIAAAALGASESGTLPGTVHAEGLHTFTLDSGASRWSSLYTLATEPSQVAASAQVSASSQVAASCSCRLLSHQTLLWHHCLGHPSLPRLCGMHSRLVSGLPRSLPPLPPSPAPPCLPCVEGRQRAAPHSSSFPLTSAPLQTLHMEMWGPVCVSGQCRECYSLLVVDNYTRPSPAPRAVGQDLPVLRLHSERGGEFSSNLLRDFCRGEGILQSIMLPDSPQKNGIAERRIGLVMEVARTSMIHAPAPHFLWPFAVRYAAHQLNLWPRVSLPETLPTLRWTGEVGDASVFRVWGSRAFVRDTAADKLSPRAIPCVFLGFVPDAPGWQFYHPTSRRVFPSQDVMFDESVPFYRLFPYRSAPPPPPSLFLAPDPLPGPAPVHVAIDSGAARGAASEGAEPGGAESEGAETGGAQPGGVETGGAEPGGVATGGGEPGGAEPEGVEPGGVALEGAESRARSAGAAGAGGTGVAAGAGVTRGTAPTVPGGTRTRGCAGALPRLSPQQLCEWFVQRMRLRSGASGARSAGAAGAGGTGVAAGAGVTRGTAPTVPGGTRTRGTGAAGAGGVEGAGAGVLTESGTTSAGGAGAGGARVGGPGAGGTGVGGPGAGGAGAVDPGGTVRPRPYFVPLLQQVLGTPPSPALTPPLLCPPPDKSQPQLQPSSPLPTPSPYTEQSGGLTEGREPASCLVSPVRTARCVPHSRPPPVPGTHAMTLHPSSVPLRTPLPDPPESSLPEVPDPESDRAQTGTPTVSRLLTTAVTDPSFESAAVSALVAELLDFAVACRLDYATALVAESVSTSPPSVGGECALGTDVLEDRQEEFECLAAAVPRFASMQLAPEGDPDAQDIPNPRSYAEAITGPYSSQWQAAMDAEMASWKSTGTYINEVPLPGVKLVDGLWIFRVKRPSGSPPAFKTQYIAKGFSQRQGVDYFQTFSPTPKMTTLQVLLHVAAQRDYELHSLDFNTAFLQGSLHGEIWLRCPPGFTESFPAGTQWSLRQPVYGHRQAPRKWHDTLRTTLAALGFAPTTADPSLFLRTDTSLPPFYVLVYVDDLVFATADNEALTLVKSELQKRHTCTDLGEVRSYLGLQITWDRAWRTITLTQSHMVHQVLQRFGFQFSSPQPNPLSTSHSLSAPPSDESVEPSGPYPELVGCLMYLMTCTPPDLAYPLSLLARYVAPGRHQKVHWDAAKRVLRYLCSTSGMGLVLGGRGPVVLTGHADASWVDDSTTQRSSQGYTFSLGSGSVSLRSTCLSSVLSSSCEAEIYAGAMAAQELCWLTYLLTDLGEQPRSPPVLFVDKDWSTERSTSLCDTSLLETCSSVATRANNTDVFTKAFPPGDHQRFGYISP